MALLLVVLPVAGGTLNGPIGADRHRNGARREFGFRARVLVVCSVELRATGGCCPLGCTLRWCEIVRCIEVVIGFDGDSNHRVHATIRRVPEGGKNPRRAKPKQRPSLG
jgi:hypothetical protein